MVMELDQSIRVVGPDGSKVVVQAAFGDHIAFESCSAGRRSGALEVALCAAAGIFRPGPDWDDSGQPKFIHAE